MISEARESLYSALIMAFTSGYVFLVFLSAVFRYEDFLEALLMIGLTVGIVIWGCLWGEAALRDSQNSLKQKPSASREVLEVELLE